MRSIAVQLDVRKCFQCVVPLVLHVKLLTPPADTAQQISASDSHGYRYVGGIDLHLSGVLFRATHA